MIRATIEGNLLTDIVQKGISGTSNHYVVVSVAASEEGLPTVFTTVTFRYRAGWVTGARKGAHILATELRYEVYEDEKGERKHAFFDTEQTCVMVKEGGDV